MQVINRGKYQLLLLLCFSLSIHCMEENITLYFNRLPAELRNKVLEFLILGQKYPSAGSRISEKLKALNDFKTIVPSIKQRNVGYKSLVLKCLNNTNYQKNIFRTLQLNWLYAGTRVASIEPHQTYYFFNILPAPLDNLRMEQSTFRISDSASSLPYLTVGEELFRNGDIPKEVHYNRFGLGYTYYCDGTLYKRLHSKHIPRRDDFCPRNLILLTVTINENPQTGDISDASTLTVDEI